MYLTVGRQDVDRPKDRETTRFSSIPDQLVSGHPISLPFKRAYQHNGGKEMLALLLQAMGAVPDFGRNFSFNASTLPNMNGEFVLSATPGSDMEKFPASCDTTPTQPPVPLSLCVYPLSAFLCLSSSACLCPCVCVPVRLCLAACLPACLPVGSHAD